MLSTRRLGLDPRPLLKFQIVAQLVVSALLAGCGRLIGRGHYTIGQRCAFGRGDGTAIIAVYPVRKYEALPY